MACEWGDAMVIDAIVSVFGTLIVALLGFLHKGMGEIRQQVFDINTRTSRIEGKLGSK